MNGLDVVLFGGTFDPPHDGHLLMAQLALEQSGADEVWFLPAPVPPHKLDERHTPYGLRVELVAALIGSMPRLSVCDIEASLLAPSYTVDTVRACVDRYPETRFRFLLGSDSLWQLPTWHQAQELTSLISFLVAVRTGHPFAATLSEVRRQLPNVQAEAIEMPIMDVSSTFIRTRVEQGLPVCGLTSQDVLEVWYKNHQNQSSGTP